MIRNSLRLLAAVFTACALVGPADSAQTTQVIEIKAHMFAYSPEEIVVKKGVPVTLELTSIDRVHGFSLPDFHLRATIQPWESTTVTFVPDKVGRFTFACDNFCGDGHDGMSGVLVVID